MPSKRKNHPLSNEPKLRRSTRAKKSPSYCNGNSNNSNDQSAYSESADSNHNSSTNRAGGSKCNNRTLVVNNESHHNNNKNSENVDLSLSSGDNDSDTELNEDDDSVQSKTSAKESKKLGLPISKDISTKDNPCSDDERCDECGSCPCDWIEYCDRIEKQRKLFVGNFM